MLVEGDNVFMMACKGGHLELVNALRVRGAYLVVLETTMNVLNTFIE